MEKLFFSRTNLDSPSMVIESIAGYSPLRWHFCSFSVFMTSVEALLNFIVSGQKSGIILIGLLYMLLDIFPLTALLFFLCLLYWGFSYYVTREIPGLIKSIWSTAHFLYFHRHLFL